MFVEDLRRADCRHEIQRPQQIAEIRQFVRHYLEQTPIGGNRRRIFADAAIHLGLRAQRKLTVRMDAQGRIENRQRRVDAAVGPEQLRESRRRAFVSGVDFKGALECGSRLGRLRPHLQRAAQPGPGVRRFGTQREGIAVALLGAVGRTATQLGGAEVQMGVHVIGLQFDRAPIAGQRLGATAERAQRVAEVEMRVGALRRQFDCAPVQPAGGSVVAGILEPIAALEQFVDVRRRHRFGRRRLVANEETEQ